MGGTRKGNERGLVWSAEDLPVLAWSQLASLWQLTLVVEPNRNTVKILYLVIYKDWVPAWLLLGIQIKMLEYKRKVLGEDAFTDYISADVKLNIQIWQLK